MPRNRDDLPGVRVYTVCDESRYLIVRNVPALGCGDELAKLFATYGDVEECKPMDAEDCAPFTDIYWIKFRLDSNARFAKRKLDDYVFLGNKLQVSYAPEFETLSDTKEKLEARRKEVLARLNPGRSKSSTIHNPGASREPILYTSTPALNWTPQTVQSKPIWDTGQSDSSSSIRGPPPTMISSDPDYFPSQSMNLTVQSVREKLNKIQSSSEHIQSGPSAKKPRADNRRRI